MSQGQGISVPSAITGATPGTGSQMGGLSTPMNNQMGGQPQQMNMQAYPTVGMNNPRPMMGGQMGNQMGNLTNNFGGPIGMGSMGAIAGKPNAPGGQTMQPMQGLGNVQGVSLPPPMNMQAYPTVGMNNPRPMMGGQGLGNGQGVPSPINRGLGSI
jgi:hypothetical protein